MHLIPALRGQSQKTTTKIRGPRETLSEDLGAVPQHPNGSQPSATPVQRDLTPSSELCRLRRAYDAQTYMQAKHSHMK